MTDKNDNFISLCDEYTAIGECRKGCPLTKPCENTSMLDKDAFTDNMNTHADIFIAQLEE